MKKIYAYSQKIFNTISFIAFTLLFMFFFIITEDIKYKIGLSILIIVSVFVAIDSNYQFFKKIIKNEEFIVKKLEPKEVAGKLFYKFLLTFSLWLKTSNNFFDEYNFLIYMIYLLYIYIVIDVTFIILNVFLGKKIIENERQDYKNDI